MATFAFVGNNLLAEYLDTCWGVFNAESLATNEESTYNVTITNSSSLISQIEVVDIIPVVMPLGSFYRLYSEVLSLLPQITGFCAYSVIFGLSIAASILPLHYLLKNWRKTPSHLIVLAFTSLISSFNIVVFGLRVASIVASVKSILCPGITPPSIAFILKPIYTIVLEDDLSLAGLHRIYIGLSLAVLPTFLWISDAFLLYRAWVIWIGHRKYTIAPALILIASFGSGITWLVKDLKPSQSLPTPQQDLVSAFFQWTPALAFSCALDAVAAAMIAGRLIYYHNKQRKRTASRTTFLLPVATIFIESAALSLISKVLQLSIPSLNATGNPLVVPLCTISSNLIVLRKALGADVSQALSKEPEELSTPRFRTQHMLPRTSSIPGGFESHLIRSIGGRFADTESLGVREIFVTPKESMDETEPRRSSS